MRIYFFGNHWRFLRWTYSYARWCFWKKRLFLPSWTWVIVLGLFSIFTLSARLRGFKFWILNCNRTYINRRKSEVFLGLKNGFHWSFTSFISLEDSFTRSTNMSKNHIFLIKSSRTLNNFLILSIRVWNTFCTD